MLFRSKSVEKYPKHTTFVVDAGKTGRAIKKGESVAVNGVCLTVRKKTGRFIVFDVITQTLKMTNLGEFKQGDYVNIERSLALGDRLHGHFVAGHIDAALPVKRITETKKEYAVTVHLPKKFRPFIVPKGSVALDGISFTVAELKDDRFKVCLIPYTLKYTTIGEKTVGRRINVEFDMLGKYVRQGRFQARVSS